MDFSKLNGKTIVWSGTFEDEEGCARTYVLTQDGVGFVLPDQHSGEQPSFLVDAKGVLSDLVKEHLAFAESIIALKALLEPPNEPKS